MPTTLCSRSIEARGAGGVVVAAEGTLSWRGRLHWVTKVLLNGGVDTIPVIDRWLFFQVIVT